MKLLYKLAYITQVCIINKFVVPAVKPIMWKQCNSLSLNIANLASVSTFAIAIYMPLYCVDRWAESKWNNFCTECLSSEAMHS